MLFIRINTLYTTHTHAINDEEEGEKERDENAESVEVAEGKMTKKNYTGRLF